MEAAVPPMSAPLCLVHNQDCKLSLNPAALAVLRGATQPVVVVAIVGLSRTGKSFLTKRMAQKCTSSPLGSAVQKQTEGIWMWCLPHPSKPGVTLVLLDTEGLRNPCRDDIRNNTWIFALALLLSSTLVYNSMRTDSRTMLESLSLLMDLKNYVRVRVQADGTEPEEEFARVFPDFVWVVRDFKLQEGERPISADEYLDQILRPWSNFSIKSVGFFLLKEKSKVQHCLHSFFPHHKMFLLERPAADRDLAQLEVLREDQLQPRFRQQEEAFCQHIWKEAPVKVLLNSSPVTGRTLARLLEAYMAAISSGSVLCVESVHTAVTEAENNAAVEAAAAKYRRGMEQDLVLPTASLDALMAAHQDWKKRAIAFFLSQALDGTEQHYQALLMDKLEAAKEEFCRRNEAASQQRCQAVLRELWGDMELRVQRGDYVAPGGIRLFQKDLKRMQEEYKRRPDKGVKEEEVLEKFLRVKGLEMIEMWLEGVDRQCKEVLAEARAAMQAVEKQLEEHKQKMVLLTKMWVVKEMLELRVHSLEEQQKETLAEVSAAKKAVEKQLEEQQQQQKVMLAEVTAAKKAVKKQLEEQQQQQKVMLAEVTAAKKAVEKQLEEQQQQQKVMLAEVSAAKKAVEKQLEEQQQQQKVMLAEVSAAKRAVEKQLEEQQQQQKVMLAEVSAAKRAVEKQLEEQQQQQKVMLAEVTAAKKAVEKQLEEQQQQLEEQQVMLAGVSAAKKAVKKQLEEQQQQQVALAKVTAVQEAAEAQLEEQQQQVMLAEVTAVMKAVEKQLEERWQQWAQQLQEEQSLVLSQRLEELEVRLREGGAEAAALQQVELMQEEEQAVPSWRSTLLKFLDKVVVPILIRVVNSVVNNAT